ncbi:UPF0284 protein [Dissostichus eleginoides]|uniref:UPF0284 protein n=1 Tax=Dissostichus eleginoides TaxID=100907 RepID=A0AAD9C208_DISEL|nr:UPF0284 protein [Dissostichus eleginoides]
MPRDSDHSMVEQSSGSQPTKRRRALSPEDHVRIAAERPKDSGDAFPAYCFASTVHHPPSPQVVEFPEAPARCAEEGEAQGRHCEASWSENLSRMSQRL